MPPIQLCYWNMRFQTSSSIVEVINYSSKYNYIPPKPTTLIAVIVAFRLTNDFTGYDGQN